LLKEFGVSDDPERRSLSPQCDHLAGRLLLAGVGDELAVASALEPKRPLAAEVGAIS
jgi:hypothetical protein